MLTLGIPSFRLEKDVVNAEIEILKELGVQIETGVEVGKDVTLTELRSRGFEAFYLAVGAQAGRKLNIEGEEAPGVLAGVDFIRDVNLGTAGKLSGKTVVIGGGNVAIDVARTAARYGASTVEMRCLESREGMPALEEEIEEALEEDILITNGWGPRRIVTENGKTTGVEFVKCLSVLDEEGRFSPKFDEEATEIVPADHVLISVGQAMDWGKLLEGTAVQLNPNGTVKADGTTYQTDESDIFAGGDALTGPKFAIDAIAMGKEAAISIHRQVHGHTLTLGRLNRDYRPLDRDELDLGGYDRLPRQKAEHRKEAEAARDSFADSRGMLTVDQVKAETERCLGCGATTVDQYQCIGCGVCTTKCKFDAVSLSRRYDNANKELLEMRPAIMKNMVKRKLRIAVTKPIKKLQAAFSGN